ncbi:MAG: IS1595 family transposase [Thermodesulfobacteriota bacterium]
MIGPYETSRLMEFQKQFPDNDACISHLASRRWPDGFACPRCGHAEAWYLPGRSLLDCKQCRFQASVTSGTILHGTRLPLIKWYEALFLMATGKAEISTSDMQRLMDIRQYRTALAVIQKIRGAVAERDGRYHLAGLVEMDSSFFALHEDRRKTGKNIAVLCAVSLYRDRSGLDKPGFAWMQAVGNPSAEAVGPFLDRLRQGMPGREKEELLRAVHAHGWKAHGKVSTAASRPYYRTALSDPRHEEMLLPWIHRLVSATRAVVVESAPQMVTQRRRAYLAELCARFNRKFWEKELFDRLVETVATVAPSALPVRVPPPETASPSVT